MPHHGLRHRLILHEAPLWISAVLILVTLAGLLSSWLLPPSVRVSQPTQVLTPIVVAGGQVQVQFGLCVGWPWPPRRTGTVQLLSVDLSYIRRILEINAVVGLKPPCRIIRPAFAIPAETPAGQYTVREDWVVTDPLGPWRTWRTNTIVLISQPFMVVASGGI